jgi:hypothetical protein
LSSQTEEQNAIRQYLLGQLSPAELPSVEERLLADSEFYEEVLIAEDELIDQYLGDTLSLRDRESFEEHFLSSAERQRKLRFATALRKYVADSRTESQDEIDEENFVPVAPVPHVFTRKDSFWSFLLLRTPALAVSVACAILLVSGGALVIVKNYRQAKAPQSILAIELVPGLTRDGSEGIKRFAVPVGTGAVRFQLALSEDHYPNYEAILKDAEGRVVLKKGGLKGQSLNGHAAVVLEVDPSLIPPGDYQIKLNGTTANGSVESVAGYSFRVVNK